MNLEKFKNAVRKYKHALKGAKGTYLIMLEFRKDAFFSVAPLSLALHELGCDVRVELKSKNMLQVKKLWTLYFAWKSKVKNEKTAALGSFLKIASKKCNLNAILEAPDGFLNASKGKFTGSRDLPYETAWLEEPKKSLLRKTAQRIWNQTYNLKKNEKVAIGFELIEPKGAYPLKDYLDSYRIAWEMFEVVSDQVISLSASTSRKSQLDSPERIGELKTTLLGLELSKESKEPVFKAYAKVSKLLNISMQIPQASFGIHADGYNGRHLFGDAIGYPSPDGKTRWQAPGQILYKLDFYPQTKFDKRKPRSRMAFTSTVPVPIFIKSCLIDWLKMEKKDKKIRKIMDSCEYIVVEGKRLGAYQTKLKVSLTGKNGRRYSRGSDVATRSIIRREYLKRTGIYAGNMGNIPAGEAFITPEKVEGTFIGDVVVNIDKSYRLNGKNPLVIACNGNAWKAIDGPKMILSNLKKRIEESRKALKIQEKHKSIPKEIVALKKKNFRNIGEFAINTNPKAELCDYLIVNEKIANMIHLALGSGFDRDRSGMYHYDIVIDSPRQQLDIYGVDKNEKRHWIHKKGKLQF